jgi:D-beta-D-heptose 7-phosphate kinase/D-beta-D-heptose 1-phosphate adenosyltransferase
MLDRLTSLVRSFGRTRVVLVGDLILDRYVYGDAERISPEAPVPVLRAVERQERVGGSANVAACLRALGAQVRCLGAVGHDAEGEKLKELLSKMGVDCGGVVVTDDRGTTTKTRLVGLAQHRHRQQLLRLDEETVTPLPAAAEEALISAIGSVLEEADVICIEDYAKGVVTAGLVRAIVNQAHVHRRPIIVDPARIQDFGVYSGASALTPNRSELEMACGQAFGSPESVLEACPGLLAKWGVERLVVTLDRDGAVVASSSGGAVHLPTRPRTVYDNTGAGDAVLSALAAAVAAGGTWEDAARLANVAGGLEVEKFGCVPIVAEEILAELRLEERHRNGKLVTPDDLMAELNLRRDRGETIVFTNGVFDVLHPGHVVYLREARARGSVLVVGLNADESVRQLGKGDDRPVHDQAFRATMLGALECVDYVVIFHEPTPLKLIERIRPDVLVKGADWAEGVVVGGEFVEGIGGRVELVPMVEGYSTTAILERIRNGRG